MANFFTYLVILSILFNYTSAARPTSVRPFWVPWLPPILPFEQNSQQIKPTPHVEPVKQVEPVPQAEPANDFLGSWKIDSQNAGVSAMHMQLMPNNKVVWYDTTSNGLSEIELNPRVCKPRKGGSPYDAKEDCTAHAIQYDADTAQIRTLQLNYNPWCSSGGLSPNGALVSTGGIFEGFKAIRILQQCDNCVFQEKKNQLLAMRWYSTQIALEDGSFVVLGGSQSQNYEIVPPESLEFKPKMFPMPFLDETDEAPGENNLYPFVNLLPDGNIFVFANDKSIIINPYDGQEIYRFPVLPGGTRNYPPSAMSALLPIDLTKDGEVNVEVIICGGNTHDSYLHSQKMTPREFLPALQDCGRLSLTQKGQNWDIEDMPSPRVMGDMLLLPTGDLLMINGAEAGTSAWNAAEKPNLTPVLYSPNKPKGQRFNVLTASEIPRMYHSSSAVLPSGEILVAGSNTNEWYMHKAPPKDLKREYKYSTDLRVEKFSPPYLAPALQIYRLEIQEKSSETKWNYGGESTLIVRSNGDGNLNAADIKVTMYAPPFTTHGYSQNQRLLILKVNLVTRDGLIKVVAPPSGKVAPPGYYLVFVVNRGVPSRGIWVKIL